MPAPHAAAHPGPLLPEGLLHLALSRPSGGFKPAWGDMFVTNCHASPPEPRLGGYLPGGGLVQETKRGAKSNPRQQGQSPRALTHQLTVHAVGDGVPPTLPSGTGDPKGIAQAELPGPAGQCTCGGRQDPGSFPGLPSQAQCLHPKPGSAKLGVQADMPLGSWAIRGLCTEPPISTHP